MLDQLLRISHEQGCSRFYCALAAGGIVVISHNENLDPISASGSVDILENLVASGDVLLDLRLLQATRFPPDTSVNYKQYVTLDIIPVSTIKPLIVLFISANPSNTIQLALDREISKIRHRLVSSGTAHRVRLIPLKETRAAFIPSCLMRYKPDIVHFSGHGRPSGEILFQDEFRRSVPANPDLIAKIFGLVAGKTRLAVFNACYSKWQATEVVKHIDFAVGMKDAIEDDSAIVFSAGFYEALAYGRSIESAFELAKCALDLEHLPDSAVPQLMKSDGVNPGITLC